ncbi:MAG TPA: cytochrome D1 domain-containing protein [Burkholderiaceae bacterium]|nr:cytochrome D1 domain-containing protein [Burkholderiaceae bacterium]
MNAELVARRPAARRWLAAVGCAFAFAAAGVAADSPAARGAGGPASGSEAGVVIERATGSVQVVDERLRRATARIEGLGDLSHAAVVFCADARFAYLFGRDGGLSKLDLARGALVARTVQAGNSIGGAISKDGRVLAVANYDPGGVKLFDAGSLELLSEIPSTYGDEGKRAKVVGIADAPGSRFVFSLFEADAIWVVDASDPRSPRVARHEKVGRFPYDGLITPDGRHYLAGLFGEDGLAMLDLEDPRANVRRILDGYGRGEQPLPVYKMPHLRGWAIAGDRVFLPAVGRHEVLVVDRHSWRSVATIPVHGQPVFVMARPDGGQVWVNFAFPHSANVQVIDTATLAVTATLEPGKAVMHLSFDESGREVWISARDDHRVVVYDTDTLEPRAYLPARSPSGIFFTWRSRVIGM